MVGDAELLKMALIRGKQPHSFGVGFQYSFLRAGIFLSILCVLGTILLLSGDGRVGLSPAAIMFILFNVLFAICMGLLGGISIAGGTLYLEYSDEKEKETHLSHLNVGMSRNKYELKIKEDDFMLFNLRKGSKISEVSVILGENSALLIGPKLVLKKIEPFVQTVVPVESKHTPEKTTIEESESNTSSVVQNITYNIRDSAIAGDINTGHKE